MNKREAGDIARAIRAAIKEHQQIDVFTDSSGNFYCQPPDCEHVGRYDADAKAKDIAADVLFIGEAS